MSLKKFSPYRRQGLASLASLLLTQQAVFAQDWPTKPVNLIVPFPPGGSNDIAARVVAEGIRQKLGQNVLVDNKPGANGSLGVEAVLRVAKEHHSFLIASDSVSLLPLFRATPWDLTKTFTPIAVLSFQPIVVVTAASSGITSIKDLQVRARAKPNQIAYGTSGQGSLQHLLGELFSQQLNIDLLHVPYKGGGQAVNDVVAGQIPVAVLGAAAVLSHIKSGKLIALAVSTRARSSMLPDAPTLRESGAGDIDVPQWSALFATEGTPAPIITKLRQSIDEVLSDTAVKQRFTNAAMDVAGMPPAQFQQRMLADRERWARLIKDRKISLE